MNARRFLLSIGLLLVTLLAKHAHSGEAKKLSGDDRKYLDGLFKDFLFDPKGAERVAVKVTVRTVWGSESEDSADGWLVAGKDGKQRVFFIDGASIVAPPEKDRKKIDFVALCRARYDHKPPPKDDPENDEVFGRMRRNAVGAIDNNDLANAAWLYRLGQEDLAAKALAAARKPEGDALKQLRAELAWSAFAGLVHAYMVRADEEALAHGEHFLKHYVKEDADKYYAQAGKIVEELKRRQKKGTFGKLPAKELPADFAKWDADKKTAFLIDALEEVDARQRGQPGGVDLGSDSRVQGLILVGDPAVPALIDALEKDERLTRSVHFWRDFARSRTVLSVREAVLTALMSILRVSVFEVASTGDNFTARGDDAAIQTAKKLRAYWAEYGKMPFDERMMKILTDPKTKFAARREAADNLANLNNPRPYRTMFGPTLIGFDPPPKLNPVIAKFSKPTVAEAILAAMDADLKSHDAAAAKDPHNYQRRQIEGTYLGALGSLDDKRIGPELAQRAAQSTTLRSRRQWAYLAHFLEQPKPFTSLADDLRQGKIKLPEGEEFDQELRGLVGAMIDVRSKEANSALDALANLKHPLHEAIARKVLTSRTDGFDREPWHAHPFCLSILRGATIDKMPTGGTYTITKNQLSFREANGGWSGGIPEFLADETKRNTEATERACDRAAEKLSKLVAGLPPYHPLFKDANERLEAMQKSLDRFAGKYRLANWREREVLGGSSWSPLFVPDIRPLDRAATAKDVQSGQAVFHLDGKGKPSDLKLPAVAVRSGDAKKENPPRVLIVQAELGPDGILCGVLTRTEIRSMLAAELTSIKSFVDLEREEAEAAAKDNKKK